MPYANQHEIEYLGAVGGNAAADREMIDEMRRRLDALRRYDQSFSDNDWRPCGLDKGWPRESPLRK